MGFEENIKNIPDMNSLNLWKGTSSKVVGFYKNYSLKTDNGDTIELDFNPQRAIVQIKLSLDSENGREYISIIKSGTIIRERDIAASRTVDLYKRINQFKQYFKYLRDDQVLKSIGGNYGLPIEVENFPNFSRKLTDDFSRIKKLSLLDLIRSYLRKKSERENLENSAIQRFFRRLPSEVFDLSIGAGLIWSYQQGIIGITSLAGYAGFTGIFLGAVDWLWRQRVPFLPKVLIFQTIGLYAVYFEVQNRVWGIFI